MTLRDKSTLRGLVFFAALLLTAPLSGCLVAGVTSGGHFFLFPSLGVILLILVLFAVLRRR